MYICKYAWNKAEAYLFTPTTLICMCIGLSVVNIDIHILSLFLLLKSFMNSIVAGSPHWLPSLRSRVALLSEEAVHCKE